MDMEYVKILISQRKNYIKFILKKLNVIIVLNSQVIKSNRNHEDCLYASYEKTLNIIK